MLQRRVALGRRQMRVAAAWGPNESGWGEGGVATWRETPAGVDNGDETHRKARGDESGDDLARWSGGRGATRYGKAEGGDGAAWSGWQ